MDPGPVAVLKGAATSTPTG